MTWSGPDELKGNEEIYFVTFSDGSSDRTLTASSKFLPLININPGRNYSIEVCTYTCTCLSYLAAGTRVYIAYKCLPIATIGDVHVVRIYISDKYWGGLAPSAPLPMPICIIYCICYVHMHGFLAL